MGASLSKILAEGGPNSYDVAGKGKETMTKGHKMGEGEHKGDHHHKVKKPSQQEEERNDMDDSDEEDEGRKLKSNDGAFCPRSPSFRVYCENPFEEGSK